MLEVNGKPYFPATACTKILGYAKPHNAIAMHCKGALKQGVLTNGEMQEVTFIPEGDLHRLITHSKLPASGSRSGYSMRSCPASDKQAVMGIRRQG